LKEGFNFRQFLRMNCCCDCRQEQQCVNDRLWQQTNPTNAKPVELCKGFQPAHFL